MGFGRVDVQGHCAYSIFKYGSAMYLNSHPTGPVQPGLAPRVTGGKMLLSNTDRQKNKGK